MDVLGSTSAGSSVTNPRGWFDNKSKDYVSPSGMAQFRTDLLNRLRGEAQILTNMNAQGIILWNIEGAETSMTYCGDPRKLYLMAPEMEAVADEAVALFASYGLRVGITIRPQTFGAGTNLPSGPTNGQVFVKIDAPYGQKEYWSTNNAWIQEGLHGQQKIAASFLPDILDKLSYAINRWGCSLFYIDSYGIDSAYKDAALQAIMTNYPNILLMPEVETEQTNYFAMTAPFMLPQWTGYFVPSHILATYPQAWGVIQITTPYSDTNQLVASLRAGNVFIGNSWYSNTGNYRIKWAYDQLKNPNPPNSLFVTAIQ